MTPPHVTIVSASIGAGHDGAAREIARRLTGLGYPVRILDFLDLLPGRTGAAVRHAYAAELAMVPDTWGWLLRTLERDRAAGLASATVARLAGARTLAAVGSESSVVVSTYPLASQVLGYLRQRGDLTVPVITFLTDMSVHPLWVASGADLHLALHEVAAAQAARRGAHVVVVGAAVGPSFHPYWTPAEWSQTRSRYGIPADRPAALVVAGSWGVGDIESTMLDIVESGVAVPVAVCGTNTRLRDRLRSRRIGVALGWVDEMAALLRSCDVVVQNAGGLTSLEAMACGVPVISYRCLAGHGLTNTRALDEAGLAVWARDRQALAPALVQAVSAGRPDRSGEPAADDPARVIAALAGPMRWPDDVAHATVGVNV
jgi:hypothetical protein